jgi:hypothetical protein
LDITVDSIRMTTSPVMFKPETSQNWLVQCFVLVIH